MSELEKLQDSFQGDILARDGRFAPAVVSSGRISVQRRIDIYADGFRLRLIEVLADTYPVLQAMVGEDDFDAMARSYIETHTSTHYSVRWYGHQLSKHLSCSVPYVASAWLAEMALFEWTLRNAFDAQDEAVMTEADMAAIPAEHWPNLRLGFHSSAAQLSLAWNVPGMWKRIDAGETDGIEPEQEPEPIDWVIFRRERQQFFRSLDQAEAGALTAARSGADFSQLCEGLCEYLDEEHVAAHAAGLLKRWIADGLVTQTT